MVMNVICGEEQRTEYSEERAMCARMPCSQYLLSLKPMPHFIAKLTPYGEQIPALDEDIVADISAHLYSYDERIYLFEQDGALFGVVPQAFFSSSLALVLRFEMDAGEALRLIDNSEYKNLFAVSSNVKSRKARNSKAMIERGKKLDEFFARLKRCLFDIVPTDSLCDTDAVIEALRGICVNASLLVGCPVNFVGREIANRTIPNAGQVDPPTFAAFIITAMMIARESAADRSINVSFEELSQNVTAVVELESTESDCLSAIPVWESIAADRLMPFGFFIGERTVKLGLQPYRREISYLGLKQKTEWNF